MPQILRATKRPELLASQVVVLRNFAQGAAPQSPFETAMATGLSQLGVTQAQAGALVTNFEKINPSTRTRLLGPLAGANAQIPAHTQAGGQVFSSPGSVAVVRPVVTEPAQVGAGGQVLAPPPPPPLPPHLGVNYQGLYCIDETGNDDLGSDEIYVITSAVHITPQGGNVVTTVRHPFDGTNSSTYGDVDSYNARIGPVASCWNQPSANVNEGMSLTTVVMEHDQGDPDKYKDEVDTAVKAAIAAASAAFPPAAPILALVEASGLLSEGINWLLGTGDDEVGTVTTVLTLRELASFAVRPPTEYIAERAVLTGGPFNPTVTMQKINTGLFSHFLASVNDNDYHVGFRAV